ncbi:MAG: glycogen/starch synthase, partial [Zestosphaera sp.]
MPSEVRRVWMLTFEYAGVKKLGGLGEAVKNLSEGLSSLGYEVTVVMPSHDVELGTELEGVICSGVRVGADGQLHHYDIRFRILDVGRNLRVILVRGGDPRTSAVLEDPYIYGRVEEKACLLSRALPCLAEALGLPDLIHSNDWHSALAAVSLKINAELKGFAVPHLHQIHLPGSPSFPWHYASPEWCGVPTELHRVWRVTRHQLESAYDLWRSAGGNLEVFSVIEADGIASVSRSMIKDLLSRYGEWLKEKVCLIHNSTDWSVSEVVSNALTMYGTGDRVELRWILVREILNRYKHVGRLEEGDALVLTTGRLTPQKGF